jgi:hypothetical protein
MPVSLTFEGESVEEVLAQVQTFVRSDRGVGHTRAPSVEMPPSAETREELMERKVATLWGRTSDDVKSVAVAIAALQNDAKDTSVPSVTRYLGGTKKEASIRALMAILRRSLDAIDRAPGEAKMLANAHSSGGYVRYRFAPEACAAILRRSGSE